MKKQFIKTLAFTALISTSAFSSLSNLYIQKSKYAILTPQKSDKSYELTLSMLDNHLLYFNDEPYRQTGRVTNQQFLAAWHNASQPHHLFKPNVAIEGMDKGKSVSYVVELSNPQFDPNSLTTVYQATLLSKNILKQSIRLSDATLFFDNVPGTHPFIP